MLRSAEISFRPYNKSFSRLTLVLRRAMTTECFTTDDFIPRYSSDGVGNSASENGAYCGARLRTSARPKILHTHLWFLPRGGTQKKWFSAVRSRLLAAK